MTFGGGGDHKNREIVLGYMKYLFFAFINKKNAKPKHTECFKNEIQNKFS